MKKKICLSASEKMIITLLSHPLYTADYVEEWINRNDDAAVNVVAALQAMAAKGFYEAVKAVNAPALELIYTGKKGEYKNE